MLEARGHTGLLRRVPQEELEGIRRLGKQLRDTNKSRVNNGARLGALRREEESARKNNWLLTSKTKLRARFSFR